MFLFWTSTHIMNHIKRLYFEIWQFYWVVTFVCHSIAILRICKFSASEIRICTSFACFSFRAFKHTPRPFRNPIHSPNLKYAVNFKMFREINVIGVHFIDDLPVPHKTKSQFFISFKLPKMPFLSRFSVCIHLSSSLTNKRSMQVNPLLL